MADDAHLLRSYVETRSEEAFAHLVERHLALVYHAALRRLGHEAHLAPDITQSVFVLLAGKAPGLLGHPSLAGWLHTATHCKVSEALRTEHRRRVRENAAQLMNGIAADTGAEADWAQLRPVLDDVLLELSDDDREAVLLRFFEGRAYAEIGERLALPEKSAHKRVERALDKLRDRLARRGITSTAAALSACLGAQAALAAPAGLAATVTSAAMALPVPAAAAFALLPFMSTTQAALATVTVVLALAGGFAVHEVRAGRAAESALFVAQRERDDWQERVRAAQRRVAETERENQALSPKPAPARAAATNSPLPSVARPSLAEFTREGRAFLAAHPEVGEALAANLRVENLNRYAGLFASLGLTPAQVDEFVRIQSFATGSMVGQHVLTLGDLQTPGSEFTRQLKELLGEDGYRQYREFSREAPAHAFTQDLAGAVYFTDSPLTATQADQFRQIARQAMNETANGKHANGGHWLYLPPPVWDAILARTPGILNLQQMAALRDFQQQAIFMQAQSAAGAAYRRDAAKASAPTK